MCINPVTEKARSFNFGVKGSNLIAKNLNLNGKDEPASEDPRTHNLHQFTSHLYPWCNADLSVNNISVSSLPTSYKNVHQDSGFNLSLLAS